MSQPIFKNPFVSSLPVLQGGATGNGTLTVDRLTHFTITQDYTVICTANSPFTVFKVIGSLDGPVGTAQVGTQYHDEDLKIFITINQGPTLFAIGDTFEFSVTQGTDLNRENLDSYDELPQKNFSTGVVGTLAGDDNLRFATDALLATGKLQDLNFASVLADELGNDISVEYIAGTVAAKAALTLQDLNYEADSVGLAGNSISVEYEQYTLGTKATATIQDVKYDAETIGTNGNSVSVEYTDGAPTSTPVVSVLTSAITVQIQSGITTALQIKNAVNAHPQASLLVDALTTGTGAELELAPVGVVSLTGGTNTVGDAGNEVVSVVGNAIKVKLQSGVSTALQVKTKVDANGSAAALVNVTITGVSSNPQTAPSGPTNLGGGLDEIGPPGAEVVSVSDRAIKVTFQNGNSTAAQIKTAIEGSVSASALVNVSVGGTASDLQSSPDSRIFLSGGAPAENYSFNVNELSLPDNFYDGNGNLLVDGLYVQGKLYVRENATVRRVLRLDDIDSGSNNSGPPIANVQKYINDLIQDGKISLSTVDDKRVMWTLPNFVFSTDIKIRFNDTGFVNTIASSNSPIGPIADGQSVYVTLNRQANVAVLPQIANLVPGGIEDFRLLTRLGDSIVLWNGTLIRKNKAARIGEGGGDGTIKATFYDPVSTVLPSGSTATFDGVPLANEDRVLFSALLSGNNRVYEASGVGSSIVWTEVADFPDGVDPGNGDSVRVQKGVAFAGQLAVFDGTTYKINDIIRFFNGTDYWEITSLKTTQISDATTDDVFTVALAGSENIIVDYSISRGTAKEIGSILVTTDGTQVNVVTFNDPIGDVGVSFSGDILASDLRLRYTSAATGSPGTMKYFLKRWSNSPGGPAGPPSYSGGGGGPVGAAAGSSGEIQFNSSGILGADSDFTWDSTNNTLTVGDLEYVGLAQATLVNNAVNATAFTIDANLYPFVTAEYSIARDTHRQIGRFLITNNGTEAVLTNDSAETGFAGITFNALLSGSTVLVRYTSSNTGFNGTLKYALRRWA